MSRFDPPQMFGRNLVGRIVDQRQCGIASGGLVCAKDHFLHSSSTSMRARKWSLAHASGGLVCAKDHFRARIEVDELCRKWRVELLQADGSDDIFRRVLYVSGFRQIGG